ncbi:MAG: hypothetical protein AB1428_12950 [Bacteroidota bacterium]
MRSYNPKVDILAQEFKDRMIQALGDSTLTQEAIADALATTQGTISRWLNYTSEVHTPAFALAVIPKEISVPLLRFLARAHGYELKMQTEKEELDGRLDDEALAITKELGSLIGDFQEHPEKKPALLRHLDRMEREIVHARSEIESQ